MDSQLSRMPADRLARAAISLEGLSVGDAFGEQFFAVDAEERIAAGMSRPGPWRYTDDTQMALSVFSVLRQKGEIDQDLLARGFSERYEMDRGYGPAMHNYLPTIWLPGAWRPASRRLFGGAGSFGNGAAMRIAPLGAYFADDLDAAVEHAALSAEITHAHSEGVAGAIAVAVAAAEASRRRGGSPPPRGSEFLTNVMSRVPDSEVREKMRHAIKLTDKASVRLAVAALGNGSGVSAQDTVPFALWCASCHLDNFSEALWLTVSGLGDRDTTCAVAGGVVACFTGVEGIPAEWRSSREPLPQWPFEENSAEWGTGYYRNMRPPECAEE